MTSNVDCYSLFGCHVNNISLCLKYAYPLTYQFYFQNCFPQKCLYLWTKICARKFVAELCVTAENQTSGTVLLKESVHDINQITLEYKSVYWSLLSDSLSKEKKMSAEINSSIPSDVVDIFWCKPAISLWIGNRQFVVCAYTLNSNVLEDAGYKNNTQIFGREHVSEQLLSRG